MGVSDKDFGIFSVLRTLDMLFSRWETWWKVETEWKMGKIVRTSCDKSPFPSGRLADPFPKAMEHSRTLKNSIGTIIYIN